jgi:tetratricopeptide (TPR) repeat protein
VVVPLLYNWWQRGKLSWREIRLSLILGVIGLLSAAHTVYLELYQIGARGQEFTLGLLEHFLLAGRAFLFYIYKLLFPFNLMFFYPRWTITPSQWWQWLFPLTVILVLSGLYLYRRRITRGPLALFLFYGVSIFPALGFINVYPMKFSFVADHFSYLSTTALFLLLSAAGYSLYDRLNEQITCRLRYGLSAILILYLGGYTMRLSLNYKDEMTLWRNLIRKNPQAWIAYSNLGASYAGIGKTEQALALYNQAIQLNPNCNEAYYNRGLIHKNKGSLKEALIDYDQAIQIKPRDTSSYVNRGVVYATLGKAEQALSDYNQAIRLNPRIAEAYYNRGNLFREQGKLKEAIADYTKALEINPDLAIAYNNRGCSFFLLGQHRQALEDLIKAEGLGYQINAEFLEKLKQGLTKDD